MLTDYRRHLQLLRLRLAAVQRKEIHGADGRIIGNVGEGGSQHAQLHPHAEEGDSHATMRRLFDTGSQRESRSETKTRITEELSDRLANNRQFTAVARELGQGDTYTAVERLIRAWGSGFGEPENQGLIAALHYATRDEFKLHDTAKLSADDTSAAGEYDHLHTGLRVFARAMYDHTQAWLQEHGITEVIGYRGMTFHQGERPIPGLRSDLPGDEGQHVMVRSRPMTSYSTSLHIAGERFGRHHERKVSVLLANRIPSARILSTPQTGFGSKSESEMVVLGGNDPTVAYVEGMD